MSRGSKRYEVKSWKGEPLNHPFWKTEGITWAQAWGTIELMVLTGADWDYWHVYRDDGRRMLPFMGEGETPPRRVA